MTRTLNSLSPRERQIMELVYRLGEASVADIQKAIPADLNYSSIRAQMTILEEKGYLRHKKVGRAYIYSPTVNHKTASRAALRQILNTFYDGSVETAVAALVSIKSASLTAEELDRLDKLIKSLRDKEGK